MSALLNYLVMTPLSPQEPYITPLPLFEERSLNGVGRIVRAIHNAESRSWFYKLPVYAIALLISALLITSIALFPLFLYGFKEYICQKERLLYDANCRNVVEISQEQSRYQFIKGRLNPLQNIPISLTWTKRRAILSALDLPKEQTSKMHDIDLLRMVALKYEDYIQRFRLRIG